METINIGKVLFNTKGDWDIATTYEELDIVFYNAKSYASRVNSNRGKKPDSDPLVWALLTGFPDKTYNEVKASLDSATQNLTSANLNLEANEKIVDAHIANKNNPHGVTKAQINLDKVENTSDVNKPLSAPQKIAVDSLFNDNNWTRGAETVWKGSVNTINSEIECIVPMSNYTYGLIEYDHSGGHECLKLFKVSDSIRIWTMNIGDNSAVSFSANEMIATVNGTIIKIIKNSRHNQNGNTISGNLTAEEVVITGVYGLRGVF